MNPRDGLTTLSADRLHNLLSYDETTGIFTWKVNRPGVYARVGLHLGRVRSDGYCDGRVDGHLYLIHRLAWMYVTGAMPVGFLDHLNGVRTDNRFANLREVTRSQNRMNVAGTATSGSRYAGVAIRHLTTKDVWRASINIGGKKTHLGHFDTEIDALAARIVAEKEYFGEFCQTLSRLNEGL